MKRSHHSFVFLLFYVYKLTDVVKESSGEILEESSKEMMIYLWL